MKILCNGIELALATLVEIINLTFFTHYVTEQEIKYKIKTLCNVHSGNPCTVACKLKVLISKAACQNCVLLAQAAFAGQN